MFAKPGNYSFLVTIVNPAVGSTFAITSSVNVTVTAALASISVTPNSVNLTSGQTQTFAATGYDQFGIPLPSQPAFSWNLATGSVGSVTGSGLYTAPLSPVGSATIVAASGTVSGSATAGVSYLKGDANLDGHRDAADIALLMSALTDLEGYRINRGLSQGDLASIADANGDGSVDNADLQGLITLINGGGASSTSNVVVAAPPGFAASNSAADRMLPPSALVRTNAGLTSNDLLTGSLGLRADTSTFLVQFAPPPSIEMRDRLVHEPESFLLEQNMAKRSQLLPKLSPNGVPFAIFESISRSRYRDSRQENFSVGAPGGEYNVDLAPVVVDQILAADYFSPNSHADGQIAGSLIGY